MSDPKPGAPLDLGEIKARHATVMQETSGPWGASVAAIAYVNRARTVIPALIAECERLRAENARLGSGVQRDEERVLAVLREVFDYAAPSDWKKAVRALATPAPAPSGEQARVGPFCRDCGHPESFHGWTCVGYPNEGPCDCGKQFPAASGEQSALEQFIGNPRAFGTEPVHLVCGQLESECHCGSKEIGLLGASPQTATGEGGRG
jgi:hypothetical protein